MKRFYRDVAVIASGDGFAIALDGKPVKTPAGAALVAPTRTLCEAIAAEWRAQGATVDPASMPLGRLANTAIDAVAARRDAVIGEIVNFARHDHLCYRAEHPAELVRRQGAAWNPLLDWAAERHGARLATGVGIAPVAQTDKAIAALRKAVQSRDAFTLTALHAAAAISGSLVLGLALADGRLDAAEAFALSQLDERFQAEKWGVDTEAELRARRLAAELDAAARFIQLSRT